LTPGAQFTDTLKRTPILRVGFVEVTHLTSRNKKSKRGSESSVCILYRSTLQGDSQSLL